MPGPSITASQREVPEARERKHEERELFGRLASGDSTARDALVQRFMPLAYKLAHVHRGHGEEEDLEQVAVIGLLKAIDRFDPGRGLAFSTFAFPTITGELRRYFRDRGWSVKVPRSVQELALRVDRATAALTGPLGRAPTVAEIAEYTDSTVEQVLEARYAGSARRPDSLDAPRPDDDRAAEPPARAVAITDPGFGAAETAATLETLMRVLPERDRTILDLRFRHDLVQSQIAGIVGLSQMQVSRAIKHALEVLRKAAVEQDRHADADARAFTELPATQAVPFR